MFEKKYSAKVSQVVLLSNLLKFVIFLIGFGIGTSIFVSGFTSLFHQTEVFSGEIKIHNEAMSKQLFDDVKVVCLVMTNPENHKTKAVHVKETWGKRCNKLLFITTQEDPELDTIVVNITESRKALRRKTKEAFLYAHDNLIEEYDWFLKADDDSYLIMENVRYLLSQYHPQTSLFFGHRYWNYEKHVGTEGYMAGAGYILSKKALKKFATIVRADPKKYFYPDEAGEDEQMGKVLAHSAIFVDCRDEKFQKRFFPVDIPPILNRADMPQWYTIMSYYNVSENSLDCCSDVPAVFHYITNASMYQYEYLIYHFAPFGLLRNSRQTLPSKLSIEEIIAASDAKSFALNADDHEDFHNLSSSEYY